MYFPTSLSDVEIKQLLIRFIRRFCSSSNHVAWQASNILFMFVFSCFLYLCPTSHPPRHILTQSPRCVVLDSYDVWCIVNTQSKGVWARLRQIHLLPEVL